MQASMIIKGQGEIVTTGFRSPGGDFVLIEIANNGNSLSVQVPNDQIINFHAAMVDALAPHVDEQRAAELDKPNDSLLGILTTGAKVEGILFEKAKVAPRDEPLAQRDPRVDPQPGDVVGWRQVTSREGDWIYYRFGGNAEVPIHLFNWKAESKERP